MLDVLKEVKEIGAFKICHDMNDYDKDKFKIHNDKIEGVVDDSFAILLNIESSIREAIKLFESLKH